MTLLDYYYSLVAVDSLGRGFPGEQSASGSTC